MSLYEIWLEDNDLTDNAESRHIWYEGLEDDYYQEEGPAWVNAIGIEVMVS